MENLLRDLSDWAWWIIAALLAIAELLVPGIFFIWLAAAAALVGCVTFFMPLPLAGQLALFCVFAVLCVLAARRWFSETPVTDHPDLNDRGKTLVGRLATASEAFANGRGTVQIGDSVWRAEGPDMAEGTQVRIIGNDGALLHVEPVQVA